MKITLLGSGGSSNTPDVTGDWGNSKPYDPKSARTSSSIYIESGAVRILIDTGFDTRLQFTRANIQRVSHILYTHPHADHLGNYDSVNVLKNLAERGRNGIRAMTDNRTLEGIRRRFSEHFRPDEPISASNFLPGLIPHAIDYQIDATTRGLKQFRIGELRVQPFYQTHEKPRVVSAEETESMNLLGSRYVSILGPSRGKEIKSIGFRFDNSHGSLAYSTDVTFLSEAAFNTLRGVDCWIVDCAKNVPSHNHSHWEQTARWIKRVKPKFAVLIHLHRNVSYRSLSARLPKEVVAAHDGLSIEITKKGISWQPKRPVYRYFYRAPDKRH